MSGWETLEVWIFEDDDDEPRFVGVVELDTPPGVVENTTPLH